MWYFVSPQIVFGEGALNALDELEGRRAFIVTDAVLVKLGIVEQVKAHLTVAGLEISVFDAVEPEPSVLTVRQGAEAALQFGPDWIVAVGGGSVMDAAKAIWVLYEHPELEPAAINPVVPLRLRDKARLITIPTTSGTGSEVTWAIVLTDPEQQRKLPLGNRANVADLAIVDPALVAGMPPQLTADTGLDALTHAVEGFTCAWHNDMTDGLCLQAIELVLRYLPRAVATARGDGADLEARERMHNAATLAGLGFGNSLAALAHAMGHALGALFHVPHGRAVGLFLPYTVEFIAQEAPERFTLLADALRLRYQDDEDAACLLADRLQSFIREVGNPTRVADLGIDRVAYEAALESLVDNAFNDGSILAAARMPSYEELRQLFLYAYDGRDVDF